MTPVLLALAPVVLLLAYHVGEDGRGLTMLVAITVGAFVAAWLAMEILVARWMRRLAGAVEAIGRGSVRAVEAAAQNDIPQLAGTLDALAATLQTRESELLRASAEAMVTSRAKMAFLANMSHELRTPLNAIMGFAEMIQSGIFGPVNHRYQEYARDIYNSGRRLLDVVEDILDLLSMQTGRLVLNEQTVDLAALVGTCRNLVAGQAEAGGIALEAEIGADLPHIVADEPRLKQILMHILTNAVKFTPRGGSVAVSAKRDADGWIAIAVRDTGMGMARADLAVALQSFQHAGSAFNAQHDGPRLGLSLAKSLTEFHQGRLEIDSEPGKGTVVTIKLPPHRVLPPEATAGASRTEWPAISSVA